MIELTILIICLVIAVIICSVVTFIMYANVRRLADDCVTLLKSIEEAGDHVAFSCMAEQQRLEKLCNKTQRIVKQLEDKIDANKL